MLAAKTNPILVIEAPLQEGIEEHAWKMRDLLCTYKVPTDKWNDLWNYIGTEEESEVFKEINEDLDIAITVGWFRGVAAVLGCKPWELVKL